MASMNCFLINYIFNFFSYRYGVTVGFVLFSVALASNTMEDRLSPESYADSTTEENTLLKNNSTFSNPSSNYLPPCRICHRKASGFHYGVNTCEACKVCFQLCLDIF